MGRVPPPPLPLDLAEGKALPPLLGQERGVRARERKRNVQDREREIDIEREIEIERENGERARERERETLGLIYARERERRRAFSALSAQDHRHALFFSVGFNKVN